MVPLQQDPDQLSAGRNPLTAKGQVNIALERNIANVSAARLRMSGNEQATIGSARFMRPIVVRMSRLVTQRSNSSGGPCKPGLLTLPTSQASRREIATIFQKMVQLMKRLRIGVVLAAVT